MSSREAKKELEHLEKLIPMLEERRYRLREQLGEVSTSSTSQPKNREFENKIREKYFR